MTWNELLDRSYTPYSLKPFACIVKGKSGKYYPGVRVENGSFPLTIYAEQSALGFCYTNGDSPSQIIYKERSSDSDFWKKELSVEIIESDDISHITFEEPFYQPDQDIRSELHHLLSLALTPESNFQVSCLLDTSKGFIAGVNIEFSDWQKGLCAERVAIATSISAGMMKINGIHVHASSGEFISPCGGCRQVIVEILPDKRIGFYHPNKTKSEYNTADLMPYVFSSSDLKKS